MTPTHMNCREWTVVFTYGFSVSFFVTMIGLCAVHEFLGWI